MVEEKKRMEPTLAAIFEGKICLKMSVVRPEERAAPPRRLTDGNQEGSLASFTRRSGGSYRERLGRCVKTTRGFTLEESSQCKRA